VGTRNLTLLSEEFAASQDRRWRESGSGRDLSEASTVTVSGKTKALLAYVWLAGDDADVAAVFVGLGVAPTLLHPGNTSRTSALTAAMTASR
jgi:hypothetical protein